MCLGLCLRFSLGLWGLFVGLLTALVSALVRAFLPRFSALLSASVCALLRSFLRSFLPSFTRSHKCETSGANFRPSGRFITLFHHHKQHNRRLFKSVGDELILLVVLDLTWHTPRKIGEEARLHLQSSKNNGKRGAKVIPFGWG